MTISTTDGDTGARIQTKYITVFGTRFAVDRYELIDGAMVAFLVELCVAPVVETEVSYRKRVASILASKARVLSAQARYAEVMTDDDLRKVSEEHGIERQPE